MKRSTLIFSKMTVAIFFVAFSLSLTSIGGGNLIFSHSLAQAAGPSSNLNENNSGIQTAIEVQKRNSERLMGIEGVVGHGIGISSSGEPIIKIFAMRAGIPGIPAKLEGIPTKVSVTGMIIAYADPTVRFARPVPIGVSTGHPDITAGTIGCRVTDGTYIYALSNNHVYANANGASIGDNVLQPGSYDGGSDPEDAIGFLYDYAPIKFDGSVNYIDAAIAELTPDELGVSTPTGDGYGTPNSATVSASVGQAVQKYGRTTGWTQGTVDTTNTTVNVCYKARGPFFCKKSAIFAEQIGIIPGTFSDGGDSGSLIVTDDEVKNPIGLLFAGGGDYTFANPIELVLNRFEVSVDDGSSSGNLSPTAAFTYAANDLFVDFTDQSTDEDGSIVGWAWDFGDGNTSTAQNPSHIYSVGGDFTVTLTVTDDGSATDEASQTVTVQSPSGITLTATGYKVKGRHNIDLSWSGASSNDVDVYRDSGFLAKTANDGAYTDSANNVGGGSYTYQVCEAGTSTCSREVTVTF